ncbi:hypothetical protein [Streptomyces sp. NPDC006551]|uniref:hypothetical protein n=1 Tax=Streptomyces sp. NPDC006551 TaxID=3157178 RepID=UPI0033B711EA
MPLAVEQVRTLSEEIPARYKGLVLLGAATGLRPGELFGLQVRHLDLLHATVSVEQQIQQTPSTVCTSARPRPPARTERFHSPAWRMGPGGLPARRPAYRRAQPPVDEAA